MKIYQTKFHHFCTVIEALYIYEFQIYTEKSKIVLFHFKQENLLMEKKKKGIYVICEPIWLLQQKGEELELQ